MSGTNTQTPAEQAALNKTIDDLPRAGTLSASDLVPVQVGYVSPQNPGTTEAVSLTVIAESLPDIIANVYQFTSANSGLIITPTAGGAGTTNLLFTLEVGNGVTLGVGGAGLHPAAQGAIGGLVTVTNPGVVLTAGSLTLPAATTTQLGLAAAGAGLTETNGTFATAGAAVLDLYTGPGLTGGTLTNGSTIGLALGGQGTLGGLGTITNPGAIFVGGSMTLPPATTTQLGLAAAGAGLAETNGTFALALASEGTLGGLDSVTGALSFSSPGVLTAPVVTSVGTLTGGTITTPGALSVALGNSGVAVEFISLTNLATALSASIGGGEFALGQGMIGQGGTITTGGTIGAVLANPGTAGLIESVTGGTLLNGNLTVTGGGAATTVVAGGGLTGGTFSTLGTIALGIANPGTLGGISGATGNATLSGGVINVAGTLVNTLPVPAGGNTITTPGTNLVALVGATGSIEYITALNLVESTGSTPSATTTGAAFGSDLTLVFRGGTAQVVSLAMEFNAYTAYMAANQPTIAITSPGTVAHGTSFGVAGTLLNYTSTPTLTLSIDGGAFGPLPGGSSYNSSTISLVVGSLAVGGHTLQLEDQNAVKSNAVSATAV